jgi:hypothetical protein
MKRENQKLLNSLEDVLKMSESKLQRAIDKNSQWDIELYKNDVQHIKNEIENYKSTYRKNKQNEKSLK